MGTTLLPHSTPAMCFQFPRPYTSTKQNDTVSLNPSAMQICAGDPEGVRPAVCHYLEALKWQKEIIKIHTIFGGKNLTQISGPVSNRPRSLSRRRLVTQYPSGPPSPAERNMGMLDTDR